MASCPPCLLLAEDKRDKAHNLGREQELHRVRAREMWALVTKGVHVLKAVGRLAVGTRSFQKPWMFWPAQRTSETSDSESRPPSAIYGIHSSSAFSRLCDPLSGGCSNHQWPMATPHHDAALLTPMARIMLAAQQQALATHRLGWLAGAQARSFASRRA